MILTGDFLFAENTKKSIRLMWENLSTLQMIHTQNNRFDDVVLLLLLETYLVIEANLMVT